MKKISMLALCAIMPICSAMAAKNMQNVIHQNAPVYWSVSEIVDMPDNTPVVLLGRITKNMGDEIFLFEDSSGNIMLQIDEEDWNGNTVRVDDVVTVYGHIDKKGNLTEVEVDSIVK